MEPGTEATEPSTSLSYQHVVSGRLTSRLYIYAIVSVGLLIASMYDVIEGDVAWWIALAAIIIGFALGYGVSRTRKIQWNATGEKIVSRWDTFGVIALILYFIAEYGRDWLFSHWFSGLALSATTFSFLAGLLFGRFLGTHHSIQKVIRMKNS